MSDLPDPDLAAALRASADNRIRQQITQAATRRQQAADNRTIRQQDRAAGLQARHATKQARQHLTQHHQQKGTTMHPTHHTPRETLEQPNRTSTVAIYLPLDDNNSDPIRITPLNGHNNAHLIGHTTPGPDAYQHATHTIGTHLPLDHTNIPEALDQARQLGWPIAG